MILLHFGIKDVKCYKILTILETKILEDNEEPWKNQFVTCFGNQFSKLQNIILDCYLWMLLTYATFLSSSYMSCLWWAPYLTNDNNNNKRLMHW